MKNSLRPLLLLAAAALVSVSSSARADFTFNVDINTSGLAAISSDPFYLELQLNTGGGTSSNIATVTNFQFTGGGPNGPSDGVTYTVSPATATGDFSTGFTLNTNPNSPLGADDYDSVNHVSDNGYADISQGFDASVTDIKFTVDLSSWSTGTTPDNFVVNLLDSNGDYLPTNDPNGNISLLEAELGSQLKAATLTRNVATYETTGDDAGVSATAALPEPKPWALIGAGFGALGFILRWRRLA